MKTIEVEYVYGDAVIVTALNCEAFVERVAQSIFGIEYKVSYWMGGERKEAWIPGRELKGK